MGGGKMKKTLIVPLLILVLLLIFLTSNPLLAQTEEQTWRWHPMMNRWWGFPAGFMMIFPLLIVIILLWPILKGPGRKELPIYRTETAMDILKKRYARGEITKEEFLEMKKDLEE